MYINAWLNSIIHHFIKKYHDKSIEKILYKSLEILDSNTLEEIKSRTAGFITNNGAFADRAGKSDIYYSLFGVFVHEIFNHNGKNENLSYFIKNLNLSDHYSVVHKYCLSIISSKLKLKLFKSFDLKENLLEDLSKPDYHVFMGILALYYQKDYLGLIKLLRKTGFNDNKKDLPCSVIAAQAIISKLTMKNTDGIKEGLMSFYRSDGSFSALKNSPVGDLLSTAVALYALNFIDADLRLIKPQCLEYIDSLYYNGSFRSTTIDYDTDIEYTFYGLLALGSLV